ncbi:MAG: hypothetical protein VB086_04360 [Clostridiaceae bacterium]|nr:hypothetical protein [Clostridiaceae bacterium]
MRGNRNRALRLCAYALMMLLIFLLQHSRGTAVQLWRATADAIPYFLATLALLEGPYTAGIFGFFAGMLLSLHAVTVEGLSALYLGLFGIVFGLLGSHYMRPVLPSALLGGTVCILLQGVLRYLFYYALVYQMSMTAALAELGAELLLSLLTGIPVYFLVRAVYRRFQENEE